MMKKILSVAALLALAACGSSTSSSGSGSVSTSDASTATATTSAVTSSLTGISSGIGGVSANVSASQLKKALLAGFKQTQMPIPEESDSGSCGESGTYSNTMSGTIDINTSTGELSSIDVTATAVLDSCTETASVTLDDGSTCEFSTTISGTMTCTISLTSGSTDTASVSCTSGSACSGMTLVVFGETHTVGMEMTASLEIGENGPTNEPEFTGSLCIDGEEVDLDDVEEVEFTAADLTCSS